MENWRDAHDYELQVQAQKEVDKRMKLPDLDIDEQYSRSLGCNSIDILNLRLELERKLRQGIRKLLGTCFLAVG